jgi:hypothetical protein
VQGDIHEVHQQTRNRLFLMKFSSAYISLILTILLGCKASQSPSFIKSESQKEIRLVGAQKPFVVFMLESGDTLKFGSHDIFLLLDKYFKNQTHRQPLSKSGLEITQALTKMKNDTIVYQKLSAVDTRTLGGILDSWAARELLLKGKALIALKNHTYNPKKLNCVFTKDNLNGQQGTFYLQNGIKIYSSVIALGE